MFRPFQAVKSPFSNYARLSRGIDRGAFIFALTAIVSMLAFLTGCAVLAAPAMPASAPPAPLRPGETLTYNVTWSVFPAGQVVSTLKQIGSGPQDAYAVNVTARSDGFVSLVYRINNVYHAVIDPETLCSRQIEKTINEGRRHKQTHIVFDSVTHMAILSERDMAKRGHPLKHAENAIPACVEDIVGAFYYLRQQPMKVGEQIRMPVNDGSKTHEVIVDVESREQVETPIGTRWAFKLRPRALGNLYNKRGRLLIWISDDAQRLPLRIKAIMLFGDITGTLQSVTYGPRTTGIGPASASAGAFPAASTNPQ